MRQLEWKQVVTFSWCVSMFNVEQANCTSIDPELFFPIGEIKSEIESILCRICMNCPINQECLDYALENNMQGYWGGTTERQRKQMQSAKRSLAYRQRKKETGAINGTANNYSSR